MGDGRSKKGPSEDGQTKRVTVTMDAHLYRQLEAFRSMRGLSRSAAVGEAIREWVLEKTEEDREKTERVSAKLENSTERLARMVYDAQLKTEEVYALLQASLSRAREISRNDISRAAEDAHGERRRYWRERQIERNRRRGGRG